MSGTMSGIIEAVITTGWSLQPPPAITWNAHYTHGVSPGSRVLLLLYHHRTIFTEGGSILDGNNPLCFSHEKRKSFISRVIGKIIE